MIRTRTTHAEVSWVGLQRIRHAARDTHELGENEWRLLRAVLRENELHRRGVHAVAEGRDDAEVGDAQEGVELVFLDCLVAVDI